MNKDVKAFVEMIKTDKAVQEQIKAVAETYNGAATDEAVWAEVISPIAEEKGFDITLDDYKAYVDGLVKENELSESELANIAGGFTFCIFVGGSGGKVKQAKAEGGVGACYYVGVGFIGLLD